MFPDTVILWCSQDGQYWAAFESLNAVINAQDFLSIWLSFIIILLEGDGIHLPDIKDSHWFCELCELWIIRYNWFKSGSLLVCCTPGAWQWWCLAPVPARLSDEGDMQPPSPKFHINWIGVQWGVFEDHSFQLSQDPTPSLDHSIYQSSQLEDCCMILLLYTWRSHISKCKYWCYFGYTGSVPLSVAVSWFDKGSPHLLSEPQPYWVGGLSSWCS